jgi:hypothetical protein
MDISSLADLIGVSEEDLKAAIYNSMYEALPKEAAKLLVFLADDAEKEGKKSVPVKRLRDMALKMAMLDKDEYIEIMNKAAA